MFPSSPTLPVSLTFCNLVLILNLLEWYLLLLYSSSLYLFGIVLCSLYYQFSSWLWQLVFVFNSLDRWTSTPWVSVCRYLGCEWCCWCSCCSLPGIVGICILVNSATLHLLKGKLRSFTFRLIVWSLVFPILFLVIVLVGSLLAHVVPCPCEFWGFPGFLWCTWWVAYRLPLCFFLSWSEFWFCAPRDEAVSFSFVHNIHLNIFLQLCGFFFITCLNLYLLYCSLISLKNLSDNFVLLAVIFRA